MRAIALPDEHGAWALWLGPFLAGWGVAGGGDLPLLWCLLGILFLFMARHTLTIAVRAYSGRRPREQGPVAAAWTVLYLAAAAFFALMLLQAGSGLLLRLALPAVPMLGWQLWLVSRRRQRQMVVELVGCGVLALAAPAAHIAATGHGSPTAAWLWLLTWLYAATSIVYVYLRLHQRRLSEVPPLDERLSQGRGALRWGAAALVVVTVAALTDQIPPLTLFPFLVHQAWIIGGTLRPAVGVRPSRIGFAQVAATALFVLLLVGAWRLSP